MRYLSVARMYEPKKQKLGPVAMQHTGYVRGQHSNDHSLTTNTTTEYGESPHIFWLICGYVVQEVLLMKNPDPKEHTSFLQEFIAIVVDPRGLVLQ